jgi:hypothetical protein
MNRGILIFLLLLSSGAGRAAGAQDTNSAAAPARISLQTLMQKNIFDPTRSGRSRGRSRAAAVRSFAFRGSDGYVAFFTGEGTPARGYVKVGDLINGFKVRQITLHFVKLAEPNGTIVELTEDNTMRREEDGPWTKSDQPPAAAAASPETQADESTAAASPASAGVSDILAKLRLKREQEEK